MTATLLRPGAPPLVLASGSATRRQLLESAGLPVIVDPAGVDEGEVKQSLKAQGADAAEVAEALADLKVRQTARRHGDAITIGADQMLDCAGVWFDKPADLDHARAHLQALAGRTHELISAIVVYRGGVRVWHHVERARLTMRSLDAPTLDAYLAAAGSAVIGSVGAYQVEGLGIHLFSRIEGDHSTILGLPLLPLLGFLRQHGVIL
ncbi:MAG: nucleoside triphosphate pyrophosphatase [Alphaproteobacteria bacterium]|nr:nucleoside triphosphate pyrophosphatase [Alphaproteobacteria bacterium]